VPQISIAFPALNSARASAARTSSFPAAASASIWASQAAPSNSANQRRNFCRSAGG